VRLRSVLTFTAAVLAAGGVLASPADAVAPGPYAISPVGIPGQCLYGQIGQKGVAPVGIVPCDYTWNGVATRWEAVTVPSRVGQMLRGTGTDDCVTYDPAEEFDQAQFQPCDGANTRSRWIITVRDDATTQIASAADFTKCLFRSGPVARVLACDTPRTPAWTFQLAQ
jgi:hypothetical protein